MSADPAAPNEPKPEEVNEHLNIKVTDGNNEVFFKIKRTTQLKKLMDAFCDRQGKSPNSVRFLFDGTRVQGGDSPDSVGLFLFKICSYFPTLASVFFIRTSYYILPTSLLTAALSRL